MPWCTAMAVSSHQPTRSPPPPPPPPPLHHSHSSSPAVRLAARMCPNAAAAAAAANRDGGFSSSPSPPPPVTGGVWRMRTGLAAASSCFREDSTPHSSSAVESTFHGFFLERKRSRNAGKSWWMGRTESVCCRGTGRGAELNVEQVGQEGQEDDARILALEAEMYDFMQKSSNPSKFPTKEELIAAGRMDLVEAIGEVGGWLAYGWDSADDDATRTDYGHDDDNRDNEEKRGQVHEREWTTDAISSFQPKTNLAATVVMKQNETAVGWLDNEILQQQRDMGVKEESGIEGILKRLEKERSFSYLEADDRISSKNKDYDPGAAASEAIPYKNRYGIHNFLSDIHMDELLNRSVEDMRNGSSEMMSLTENDLECINSRLQLLGAELDSVLSSLGSRTDALVSHKGEDISVKDLYKLSDVLEFQETEIMNAQDKLRSIQAKLAALEGKMTLEIIEAQKIVEERQKRIDTAQKGLRGLRTAYVVWPNTASEVFLVGSFDGWSSQMRMEKSDTGIFSLYLKLYPGQYEIKFIVDGLWKIDPLRLTVYNNGHENNLLIIP